MVKLCKTLFILGLLYSRNLWAYGCPEIPASRIEYIKAIKFLSEYVGPHELGKCRIEFQVCNPNEPKGESKLWGEIFIYDLYQREQYAPLYYEPETIRKTFSKLEAYHNSLFFLFQDGIPDSLNGNREAIRLDVIVDPDNRSLQKVALGIYGTQRRVERRDGSVTSRWSTCEK